jgi:hypothetical protein
MSRFIVVSVLVVAANISVDAATVRFRLLDVAAGRTTPAMVCISDVKDDSVRLPPDGRVCESPGKTDEFYEGIRFKSDRNWIGPVRKMAGRGDNDDRSFVYELRPSLPYWSEPVMFQTSGDFTIDLPAGKWRIAVERGNEYIPVTDEFMVADEAAIEKTIALKRWIDLPARGWYSGDVHVHHPILEEAHREYLLHYARAEDVHVVNVLEMGDHKRTRFKQMGFGKPFRVRRDDYCLVAGQEEPRSEFGHIIGLNMSSLARDVATYDFYDLAFKRIHEQPDALVGFAHFAWNGCSLPRGFPWYVTTEALDFVELLQFGLINHLGYYDYLNLGFRLTAAAGSDIPWGSTLGEVRTFVYTGRPFKIDTWFANLKKGHSFVSNGPALEFAVDGQLPGSEIRKQPGQTVTIKATASGHPKIGLPKYLTVVSNDGVIKEVGHEQGGSLLSVELRIPVKCSRWIAAGVVCDNNALAHSTPVYVIVDDQPTWCPKRGPLIIQNQLTEIAKIESEFTGKKDDRSKGILERLQKARDYYSDLRQRMNESQ